MVGDDRADRQIDTCGNAPARIGRRAAGGALAALYLRLKGYRILARRYWSVVVRSTSSRGAVRPSLSSR